MALVNYNCAVCTSIDKNGGEKRTYNLYLSTDGEGTPNNAEEAEALDLTLDDLKALRRAIKDSINLENKLRK